MDTNAASKPPKSWFQVRWLFEARDKTVSFPILEDQFATLDDAAEALRDQDDGFDVTFIDMNSGTCADVTRLAVQALCSASFDKSETLPEHIQLLAIDFDIEFYDAELAERVARAYAHQVQQDYTSHVRGW